MVSNPLASRDSIYTVTVYLRIPFPSVFLSDCGCTTIQDMRIPLSAFTTFLLYPCSSSGVGGRYYGSTFELQLTCHIISIPAPSPDHPSSSCIIASLPSSPSISAVNCPVPLITLLRCLPSMLLMLLYPSPSSHPRANAEIQQGNERNYKERSN